MTLFKSFADFLFIIKPYKNNLYFYTFKEIEYEV